MSPLVKSNYFISKSIDKHCEITSELSRQADKGEGCEVAEVLTPLGVMLCAGLPQLVQIFVGLIALVKSCIEDRDTEHNEELMLHVLTETAALQLVNMAGFEATLGHQHLVGITLLHYLLLHRLIGSANPVAVHVDIHIVHLPNVRKNTADHEVVLIENMLRQGLSCSLTHKLCAEGAGMDGQHLMKSEGTGLIPCENSVPRQAALIADRSVANAICMHVEVVGNHKVDAAGLVAFL